MNGFPEEQLGSPQIMEAGIRAAVFVDEYVFIGEGENAGHRAAVFGGQADLQQVTTG